MMVQLGNIIAAYIYLADDAPKYHRGNQNLVIINFLAILTFLGTKVYYILRNRHREKIWRAMAEEERNDYIRNTKLRGSRRLDFRFAH